MSRLESNHPIDTLLLAAIAGTQGQVTEEVAGQTWTVEEVELLGREAQRNAAALITLRGSKGSTNLYRVVIHADGIDFQRPLRT